MREEAVDDVEVDDGHVVLFGEGGNAIVSGHIEGVDGACGEVWVDRSEFRYASLCLESYVFFVSKSVLQKLRLSQFLYPNILNFHLLTKPYPHLYLNTLFTSPN